MLVRTMLHVVGQQCCVRLREFADGTTIFDLKRSPCRVYPFELYLNLFLMCA